MNQQLLQYAELIVVGAHFNEEKTGRFLFNHLPPGAAKSIQYSLIDPFDKKMNAHELYMWLDDHLIFDKQQIVGVINNDAILWEAKPE